MIDGFLEALAGLLVAVGQQVEDEGHNLGEIAVHLLLTVLRLQVPANQSVSAGTCWWIQSEYKYTISWSLDPQY